MGWFMPVTGPRSRLLVIRMSQDEYASLEKAAKERGARSRSDYCRDKLLEPRDNRMTEIHEELKGLRQRMEKALKRLDNVDER